MTLSKAEPHVAINGFIFIPHKARKRYRCYLCRQDILPGTFYYAVEIGGGGLSSMKFPDRIHIGEIQEFIDRRRANGGQDE